MKGGAVGAMEKIEAELNVRRSPRSGVRKVKKVVYGQRKEVQSEQKHLRKRKAVNYEDDPSFSEEENVEESKEQQRKVPGYRCSSHLIPELMEKLSGKQRGWVKNIGFDALDGFIGSRCPKSLTMWLVDLVDTTTGDITVCGVPVNIKQSVMRILGLPAGSIAVPQPLNGRSKAKKAKLDGSLQDGKHTDHGRGQSAKDATKILLAENEDEESFCRSFVMVVLCIYLAPTTSMNINRNYLPALMDVSQIALMDWCGFIADYPIRGIEEFRNSKASHVQVPGCVHLLPLIYIDALIQKKALLLPEAIALSDNEPRSHYIKTEHFSFLASADMNNNSKDKLVYGLLQANHKKVAATFKPGKPKSTEKVNDPTSSQQGLQGETSSTAESDEDVDYLMVSLLKEVVNGREKLVDDFRRKIVEFETEMFARYRNKISLRLARSNSIARTRDEANKRVQHTHASAQVGEKTSASTQLLETAQDTASASAAKESADSTLGKDNKEHAEPKNVIHDSSEGIVQHNGTMLTTAVTSVQGVISLVNSFTEGNHLADLEGMHLHDECVGVEPRELEMQIQEPEESYDELNCVVQIGKEAAEEASFRDEETDKGNPGISLSILSEVAACDGPPLYDTSPVHVGQMVCPLNMPEESFSLRMHQMAEQLSLPNPVYDDSPCKNSFMLMLRKNKMQYEDASNENEDGTSDMCIGINHACLFQEEGLPDEIPADTSTADAIQDKSGIDSSLQTMQICGTNEPAMSEESNDSLSYGSKNIDSDDGYRSSDVPSAREEGESHWKNPLDNTPGFIQTPSYTFDTQENIDDLEIIPNSTPVDITHIAPLKAELELGCRFKFGGTASNYTGKLIKSINQIGANEAGIDEAGRMNYVLCRNAEDTYRNHVSNTAARVSKRFKNCVDFNRTKTKIQIKGYHITKGEFVDALKPYGEVCQSLMGLCSVVIMADWENSKWLILDQATIGDLMKEGHFCNHNLIAARLRRLNIDHIEEIFLPMLTGKHWILGIVNVPLETVELYDSLLPVADGDHPHESVWKRVAENLEHAYGIARRKSVTISFFECSYPKIELQANTHDCGFHVIQRLECYKTEDVVGYGKKRSFGPYRKYLCHLLVYHRFNDLNPLRPNLPAEVP